MIKGLDNDDAVVCTSQGSGKGSGGILLSRVEFGVLNDRIAVVGVERAEFAVLAVSAFGEGLFAVEQAVRACTR